MSNNGPNGSSEQPLSPSNAHFSTLAARAGHMAGRSSFDSDRSSASSPLNGSNANGVSNGRNHSSDVDSDPVARLQLQLEQTMEEKETLAAQYRTLLAKLTTMKASLGNKLKQDAVCILPIKFFIENELLNPVSYI